MSTGSFLRDVTKLDMNVLVRNDVRSVLCFAMLLLTQQLKCRAGVMVVLQAIASCCKLTALQLADHTHRQVHTSARPGAVCMIYEVIHRCPSVSLLADTCSSMLDVICSLLLCLQPLWHRCLGTQAVAMVVCCSASASDPCDQVFGISCMKSLAKLQQLKVLNVYNTVWRKDAIALGAEWLVARLLWLKVFNAPESVLVRLPHLPACWFQQNYCAIDVSCRSPRLCSA